MYLPRTRLRAYYSLQVRGLQYVQYFAWLYAAYMITNADKHHIVLYTVIKTNGQIPAQRRGAGMASAAHWPIGHPRGQ